MLWVTISNNLLFMMKRARGDIVINHYLNYNIHMVLPPVLSPQLLTLPTSSWHIPLRAYIHSRGMTPALMT